MRPSPASLRAFFHLAHPHLLPRSRPRPARRRLGTAGGAILLAAVVAAAATVNVVLATGATGGSSSRTVGAIRPAPAARPGTGDDADPFRAGQPGLIESPLAATAAAVQADRAARIGVVLGLPVAARRAAVRVVDRFGGRTYDEVTEYDGRDRLVSMQRFGLDGSLVAAVRFGWYAGAGGALHGASGARVRAERLVAALGFAVAGRPRVVAAPSNGGWTVAWDRAVDGVPVRGDGLRVQLWPDGSVHGVSRSERALAPRPARVLERSLAAAVVEAQLDRWFATDMRGLVKAVGMDLVWVAPNDTFSPAGADALAPVLRLAWVARVATSGILADGLRGLEIYVDAGDGSIVGGDVLQ